MIYIELFNWVCSAHEYTEKICNSKCSRWEEKDAQQNCLQKDFLEGALLRNDWILDWKWYLG